MKTAWLIAGGAVAGFVGWQVYQKLRYSTASPFYKSQVIAPPRPVAPKKKIPAGVANLVKASPRTKYNSNQVTPKQTKSGWKWYNAAGQEVWITDIYFLNNEVTAFTELQEVVMEAPRMPGSKGPIGGSTSSNAPKTVTVYKVTKTGERLSDWQVVSSYPTPAASQQLQGLSQNVLVY